MDRTWIALTISDFPVRLGRSNKLSYKRCTHSRACHFFDEQLGSLGQYKSLQSKNFQLVAWQEITLIDAVSPNYSNKRSIYELALSFSINFVTNCTSQSELGRDVSGSLFEAKNDQNLTAQKPQEIFENERAGGTVIQRNYIGQRTLRNCGERPIAYCTVSPAIAYCQVDRAFLRPVTMYKRKQTLEHVCRTRTDIHGTATTTCARMNKARYLTRGCQASLFHLRHTQKPKRELAGFAFGRCSS